MSEFTHIDEDNNPHMVDVGGKEVTHRRASARAMVRLPEVVFKMLKGDEIQTKKGPVFQTAIIAGIMGAKKTSELIPLCHPLGLNKCDVNIKAVDGHCIQIDCTVDVHSKTGVEMEALTGASVAALTIYDMCKAFSHDIVIESISLTQKSGGKRDFEREG